MAVAAAAVATVVVATMTTVAAAAAAATAAAIEPRSAWTLLQDLLRLKAPPLCALIVPLDGRTLKRRGGGSPFATSSCSFGSQMTRAGVILRYGRVPLPSVRRPRGGAAAPKRVVRLNK